MLKRPIAGIRKALRSSRNVNEGVPLSQGSLIQFLNDGSFRSRQPKGMSILRDYKLTFFAEPVRCLRAPSQETALDIKHFRTGEKIALAVSEDKRSHERYASRPSTRGEEATPTLGDRGAFE
ncbi:hypothetical protein CERZMDRAFT_92188 [Cercospora zeae-maydis SCOH1-5]|uniref:Uncharacterized protein n=1 Tax=Cercospora zeae-maydis SCOH1-5 TaxID=717836 RepID=A0A6A6FWB4_9PEZI|nr:hypothetical protein CERZMDRAFT_92188 [Cercospora zeae-maydis SCOH1-5]